MPIIDQINNMMDNVRHLLDGHSYFNDLLSDFDLIPNRMDQPMQLAIVGKISSSKSTLVNAMLGEPEIVRTGEMEETWNVSWLKYGQQNSDIIVCYKDGKKENVARDKWAEWANRDRSQIGSLKNTVAYIEVAYPHEILKSINIIDTPGLDSFYGTDSQNTLDFIKNNRPDAIILLFSKSIHAETLKIVEDFRQNIGYNFSPINTMGAMSKIDEIWNSNPEDIPIIEAKKVTNSLMSAEIVKNSLFDIYPVTAFVALAAHCLNEKDVALIRQFLTLQPETISKLFKSETRFVKDYEDVPIPISDRIYLLNKYSRFGIHLVLDYLNNNNNATLIDIKEMLFKNTGYTDFMDVIQNHFAQRATIIKSNGIIFEMSSKCRKIYKDLQKSNDPDNAHNLFVIVNVIKEVDNTIRQIEMNFAELNLFSKYYEGHIDIIPEEFDEFRRLSGEFGSSCIDKLGLDKNTTIHDLLFYVQERITFWNTKYNMDGMLFPEKEPFMKLMINLYNMMYNDLHIVRYRLNASMKFLKEEKYE